MRVIEAATPMGNEKTQLHNSLSTCTTSQTKKTGIPNQIQNSGGTTIIIPILRILRLMLFLRKIEGRDGRKQNRSYSIAYTIKIS
jgi:hypothetical protein